VNNSEELGRALSSAHLPRQCRLKAERIVSMALVAQARSGAEYQDAARRELSQALATEILRRPSLHRLTHMSEFEGDRYTIDAVVLAPDTLAKVLVEVWRAGFEAKEAA
jgi:hypothetical protein